jgi:pilus assembly protein CpaB
MVSGVKRSGVFIGVGAAAGLALIAYGANRLTAHRPAPAPTVPVERPRVVSAIRPIPQGKRIEAADITVVELPGAAPLGALTAAGTAIGRVAAADIPTHKIVLGSDLASTASLASQVPVGYRAISIQTNDEIAVSDLLRPGDIVDVELVLGDAVLSKGAARAGGDRSESSTLLQAVRVVSVGDLIGPAPPAANGQAARSGAADPQRNPPRRTMTLAMTPEQIARFTLARNLGSFYLALRNPADREGVPRALARLPDIRVGTPPATVQTVSARPARAVRTPRGDGVELVVGDQHQTIFPQ